LTLAIFFCSVLAWQEQDQAEFSYRHSEDDSPRFQSTDSEGGSCRRHMEEVVSERRYVEDEEEREDNEDSDERKNSEDDDDVEHSSTIRDSQFESDEDEETQSTEKQTKGRKCQKSQSSCQQCQKFEKQQESKTKESCHKFSKYQPEELVSLEDELKSKIKKIALEKEMDSLLTLMKLEQQLKDVSHLLREKENKLVKQFEKVEKQSNREDKQEFKQSCHLKQKKVQAARGNSDKLEQTVIIKSKYRKVSDIDEEEPELICNKENSHKKVRKQFQSSRKEQSERKRDSPVRRDIIVERRVERLSKEQKDEQLRRPRESRNQKVCINRPEKVLVNPSNANEKQNCGTPKIHAQRDCPSIRRQCSSKKVVRPQSGKPSSPKRKNVKVEEIKIEKVHRR